MALASISKLPPEILREIAFSSDTDTQLVLCLVSKGWRQVSMYGLYRNIVMWSAQCAEDCFQTLRANGMAAEAVRNVVVNYAHPLRGQQQQKPATYELFSLALVSCPQITTLKLYVDPPQSAVNYLSALSSHVLQHLRHFESNIPFCVTRGVLEGFLNRHGGIRVLKLSAGGAERGESVVLPNLECFTGCSVGLEIVAAGKGRPALRSVSIDWPPPPRLPSAPAVSNNHDDNVGGGTVPVIAATLPGPNNKQAYESILCLLSDTSRFSLIEIKFQRAGWNLKLLMEVSTAFPNLKRFDLICLLGEPDLVELDERICEAISKVNEFLQNFKLLRRFRFRCKDEKSKEIEAPEAGHYHSIEHGFDTVTLWGEISEILEECTLFDGQKWTRMSKNLWVPDTITTRGLRWVNRNKGIYGID